MARAMRHLAALCLPRDGLHEALAANTAAALTSDYSEANPRPGASTPNDDLSRLVPVVSGAQGEDLELVVLRGGQPMLADQDSVQLGYRFAGGTDDEIRGWNTPGMLLNWSAVISTTGTAYHTDVCAAPRSQKVIVTYGEDGVDRTVHVYDPATNTFATPVTIGTAMAKPGDCLVALPTGRILLLCHGDVYRSDDDGATWSMHARGAINYYARFELWDRARMAYNNGSILIMVDPGQQWVSDDLLTSASAIDQSITFGDEFSVVALPTGGFAVGYTRDADGAGCVRILTSAWEDINDAAEIEVNPDPCARTVLVAEPDGMLWFYSGDDTNPHEIRLHFSTDNGQTWTEMIDGAARVSNTANVHWTNLTATSAGGRIYMVHNWVEAGPVVGGVGFAGLGGWSNLTGYPSRIALSGSDGAPESIYGRPGFGPRLVGGNDAACWTATVLPGTGGLYTANGAGTQTITGGELVVSTTANTRFYTRTLGTLLYHCEIAQGRVDSGGSLTTDDIAIGIRVADGTDDREIRVRFSTLGARVVDVNNAGATLATVLFDTTENFQIAISVDQPTGVTGASGVWWRRPGQEEWTEIWSGSLTNDAATPNATGLTSFGHIASSTSESAWRFVGDTEGTLATGTATPAFYTSGGAQPSGWIGGAALGRPLTNIPVPIPEAGHDGETAWLHCEAGPGALGEVFTVEADHDHPVQALFPQLSPSPGEKWRSTDKSEQIITFDFDFATSLGNSIALVAIGCNFANAYLEVSTGGAWTTIGTLGLDEFDTLTYQLAGDVVFPGTVTPAGPRFLQENEAAGGYFVLDAGITDVPRAVRWHSAGAWTPTSGDLAQRPRFVLDGVDGTEAAAGAAYLVHPSGVLVVHSAAITSRRYWRIRIPANQVTPYDHYEAGLLTIMAIRGIGRAPDWGHSREVVPNAETRRSRRGVTRVRELGPPITSWTWGWTDGVSLTGLRNGVLPDYLSTSVSLPLATREDVPWLLRGFLERTRSGAIPVVALARVPDASNTTLVDRTLWHYGRLTGTVRQDNYLGREGSSEHERVQSITVEGIG